MNKQRFPKHLNVSPKLLGVSLEYFLISFAISFSLMLIFSLKGIICIVTIAVCLVLAAVFERVLEPHYLRHKFRKRKTTTFNRFKEE